MAAESISDGGPRALVSYSLLPAYVSGGEGVLCGLGCKDTVPFTTV